MVELEIPDNWVSNILKAGGVLIVLVMVGTLVRPSITGNVTNRMNVLNADLQQCYTELNSTDERLEDTSALVDTLSADISNLTHQLHDCAAELYFAEDNLTNVTDSYESLKIEFEKLDELNDNLTERKDEIMDVFREFADSVAVDICCGRSPDVEYESYDITDESVDCRTEDNGEFELHC